MSWIDELNKELSNRREYSKTSDAKEEAKQRKIEWIASQGGKSSIKQLLDWQKENDFSIGDVPKTEEHKKNIGKSNKGKIRSDETKKQISKTIIDNNSKLTKEEKQKKFTSNSMSGKKHSIESKSKMREKALGRIITDEQRKKISDTLGIPIIATNLKTGVESKFKSTREANEKLGLTGVLHVLKGRAKQCGGYTFRYEDN